MSKKILVLLFLIVIVILIVMFGCSVNDQGQSVKSDAEIDAALNQEVAKAMSFYSKALSGDDPSAIGEFKAFLAGFDAKYGSNCTDEFTGYLDKSVRAGSRLGTTSNFPPLTDLPIVRDGDVYLSGGVADAIGALITWVAPNVTRGQYVHGAIVDTDKFDPTNLDCACFQTAVADGANYETPREWMTKPNVAVMKPAFALNPASLNAAQAAMDAYCSKRIATSYGFFKDMVNIFSLVTKSDNTYWYCTKAPWRVYNSMGIDIDSNSLLIDWTTSGLYSIIKAYYKTIYFWSSSLANSKLNQYIASTRNTLVLAEEIYYSPYLQKCYEAIRY